MKNLIYSSILLILLLFLQISCGPLNPVNDFFGIQMNPDEETNFIIVNYSDIDGATYRNSISMNPKINAWAEFSVSDITVKVVNNSSESIPLSYTSDQFILVTNEQEYYLSKGGRSEYFKKGMISPNSDEIFIFEYPNTKDNIAKSGANYSDQRLVTKDVLRNYSKNEGHQNVFKENIKYFIIKLGEVSIVLKKVPEN